MFDKHWMPRLGLGWDDFTLNGFEFYDRLSFMKAGINFADAITTVSPTYAQEIQRPEYGYGLDGVIRDRRDALVGILNGIDTSEWNPATDRSCRRATMRPTWRGRRRAARVRAGARLVLPPRRRVPLIGMVSRLARQKGFDLMPRCRRCRSGNRCCARCWEW